MFRKVRKAVLKHALLPKAPVQTSNDGHRGRKGGRKMGQNKLSLNLPKAKIFQAEIITAI